MKKPKSELSAALNEGDPQNLEWTPLIKATALGSIADLSTALAADAVLEETDSWSRTPWLIALLKGDMERAQLLLERGANVYACGRCNKPPLFYAIEAHHPEMLQWLIVLGHNIEQTDDFGITPLMHAVDHNAQSCIDLLITAGAEIERPADSGNALSRAHTKASVQSLLAAKADPAHLSSQGRRALLGLSPEPTLLHASKEDFSRAPTHYFGKTNPERIQEPFWESMIYSGVHAFHAAKLFKQPLARAPIWCAARFGQSLTLLPDGRIIQIGGEHEDAYDPDFCIYNDLFVHHPDGSIILYGYPEIVFPPTDFHTATLLNHAIYVIGSLGYPGTRRYIETPVYRFDLENFRVEALSLSGKAPGWIFRHRAALLTSHELRIWGGKKISWNDNHEVYTDNTEAFILDIEQLNWRPCPS